MRHIADFVVFVAILFTVFVVAHCLNEGVTTIRNNRATYHYEIEAENGDLYFCDEYREENGILYFEGHDYKNEYAGRVKLNGSYSIKDLRKENGGKAN